MALATAAGGEGDLSHDKLSHLRIVGNGFGALIYVDCAGPNELMKACTYVLQELVANENLPRLLVCIGNNCSPNEPRCTALFIGGMQ